MTISYFILFLSVIGIFLFCYFIATRVWIKVDEEKKDSNNQPKNRRDFLYISSMSIGGLGVASFMWPFVKSMSPAEDTLALGSTEVDLSEIGIGQSITVKWRGKPVFIKRRTEEEIFAAQNVDLSSLRDPISDEDRVQNPEWLVLEGVCTHLGCVPLGQKMSDTKGEFEGWFCPCHGSHYDTSGRIRKGPAPENLAVPPYRFLSDTIIKIG
ncbi:MAG: Ubiquinol-cytochrome c reductase iron-sulfur subunit [Alphaproteobacteria bacterium MarineAlpha5_Bin6]|nr:MAG: Ubiquinol-cytochrome c reductase iron-sulfur subunit [Alphaproteobacteria bacterium MarineAlpha5_Bin7]PPR54678.1 MAG: Ubiquinol-cytochrome c reductase iron-sulfur subunit [Alphaproteobacteria bacterium MarineAlpha5_Bin6]|tara:strand:- start:1289 stop:1921 length:633 start_codon:yes stop_codon:yes gene_type:complete